MLRANGYRVYFIYLTLENWELSAVRVTQRVSSKTDYYFIVDVILVQRPG